MKTNKLILVTLCSLTVSPFCLAMLRTSSPDYGAIKPTGKEQVGKITAIVGPMASGKSLEFIRVITVLTENALHKVFVCKPEIDTRTKHSITSRFLQAPLEAHVFKDPNELLKLMEQEPADYLACDEVQFTDKRMLSVITQLLKRNINVIVAGLDTNFRTEPFGQCMPDLLAMADDVTKCKAVCSVCRQWNATLTQRLVNDKPARRSDPDIVIDDGTHPNVTYEPRCRNCHELPE